MRVVLLLGRSTGGIGTHVVDLRQGLQALGDEVAVVTDASTADRFQLDDALRWWPSRRSGVVGSLRGLRSLRTLARGADVVHAHGHQAGLLAAVALLGLPTPVVVSQHNAILPSGGRRRASARLASELVQRLVCRRSRLVTGASSDLVDEARRHGARDARLATVPAPRVPGLLSRKPVDVRRRREQAATLLQQSGVTATGPLVLTISRIAPQKSLDVLLAAAADLRTPCTWVVLGDGDQSLLDRLLQQLGQPSAGTRAIPVHFLGAVPDPTPWLEAAEVFVLPSRWEARALVVQEAMAAGTPVVSSDVGGLHDLVDGAGVLVPAGDAHELARAVESVLADSELRGRLSELGRLRAATWEDSTATARRWHQWYSALARMT